VVVGSAIVQEIDANATTSDLPLRIGRFVAPLVAAVKAR
jgi:tryptophan synthase alpha subunit